MQDSMIREWQNAQHRYSTRFATLLQNGLQVFVARFTVPLLFVEIVSLGSRISLPRLMLASYQSSLNIELEPLPIKKKKTRNLGVDLQITAYR